MSRTTILGLFESKGDLQIDEAKLSAGLRGKLEQLDAMLLVLDGLKEDLHTVRGHSRSHQRLLLFTVIFAGLGLVFGAWGLLQGSLGMVNGTLALAGGLGILLVDFYLLMSVRRLNHSYAHKKSQLDDLSNDLDSNIDRVYDQVLAELYPPQRPLVKRRVASVQRASAQGEKSAGDTAAAMASLVSDSGTPSA